MSFDHLRHLLFKRPAGGQKSNYTAFDRYPAIFSAVRLYSEQNQSSPPGMRSILSYGCSTGEECFSLRKYFPDDDIYGCDSDQEVLAITRRRSEGDRMVFFESSPAAINRYGPFDIIFSFSSLCFYPEANVKRRKNPFSYGQFRKHVETLDANLKPNGILILYNTNYNFLSLETSYQYDAILPDTVFENGYVNKHHEDSTPFTITLNRGGSYCHQMVSPPGNYTDIDFRHCIYHKTGGDRKVKGFSTSPVLDNDIEVVSTYSFSDDDLFQGKDLLRVATRLEVLRSERGIFEKFDIKRISIEQPGQFLPVVSFVRAAHW